MAKLELHFTSEPSPELIRSSFVHGLLEQPRCCVRGKNGSAYDSPHSFQWTHAVKALCVFALKNAAWNTEQDKNSKPQLCGTRNSIAASLDYALSKQPQWLTDMFGVDKRGRVLLRRLIHRSNPEMKRAGPVMLSLNDKALSPEEIVVFVGGRKITKRFELLNLAQSIERGVSGWIAEPNRADVSDTESFADIPRKELPLSKHTIQQLLQNEVFEMLWQTDIFSPSCLNSILNRLRCNPSIVKRVGESAEFVNPTDLSLTSAERLGMGIPPHLLKRVVNKDEPLRIVCSLMMPGALMLFEYLKRFAGFNLEIDYEWGYTAEVRRAITDSHFRVAPDLFVLGIAPAATAVGQTSNMPYQPMMLVPSISHRVLTSQGSTNDKSSRLEYGSYNFLCEEASSPEFCFDNLERNGFVDRRAVQVAHLEPDDAAKALAEGDPDLKMLMFFPHYSLNELLNNCEALRFPNEDMGIQEGVLFAHESLIADKQRLRCLDVAIRNAWIELRTNPGKLSLLVEQMVEEERFVDFLFRFTGVHNLPNICAPYVAD